MKKKSFSYSLVNVHLNGFNIKQDNFIIWNAFFVHQISETQRPQYNGCWNFSFELHA